MERNEENVCYDRKDAKRMVTNVQAGRSGKVGEDYFVGGRRSKLGATDQMEDGCWGLVLHRVAMVGEHNI